MPRRPLHGGARTAGAATRRVAAGIPPSPPPQEREERPRDGPPVTSAGRAPRPRAARSGTSRGRSPPRRHVTRPAGDVPQGHDRAVPHVAQESAPPRRARSWAASSEITCPLTGSGLPKRRTFQARLRSGDHHGTQGQGGQRHEPPLHCKRQRRRREREHPCVEAGEDRRPQQQAEQEGARRPAPRDRCAPRRRRTGRRGARKSGVSSPLGRAEPGGSQGRRPARHPPPARHRPDPVRGPAAPTRGRRGRRPRSANQRRPGERTAVPGIGDQARSTGTSIQHHRG
jgi:hypothetical protein